VLLALVLALAGASVARNHQLGVLAGIADEYFNLGARLRVTGTLGLGPAEPSALRPPGYPAFIAVVLWALVGRPSQMSLATFQSRGEQAVYLAQAILLGLTATCLYLWLRTRLQDRAAWIAALVLGTNPYSIALVGLLHYDVLHWLLLVLAAWATDSALRSARPGAWLLGAGALWGVANLVRPVTQLLPFFLFVALWWVRRQPVKEALRAAASLFLGMALALLPWAARNYGLTGRLVAVADNPWATLWGQTAHPQAAQPNRYAWFDLYQTGFMTVFTRVTGLPAYDYATQNRRNAEVEDAFRAEALRNLRERPLVYAGNAARAFASFSLETNSVLLSAYQRLQADGRTGRAPTVSQSWFRRGDPQALSTSALGAGFVALSALVTALAALGLVQGLRAGDLLVTVTAAVLACIGLTQALVFLHMLHYYAKLPILLVWSAVALDAIAGRWPRAAVGLQAALAGASVALGGWMVFAR
jgi:4-amino-4-deoxy-L-arabinose transferase-like glycosyltransferase